MRQLTITQEHQTVLRELDQKYELRLLPFAERYGIQFTLKLIRYLTKKRSSPPINNRVDLLKTNKERTLLLKIYMSQDDTKKEKLIKQRDLLHEEYCTLLQQSGFKLFEWNQDFVDKDTGNVVSIKRKHIFLLTEKPA